ncbi:DUF4996 domain-containing protein [Chryseobacterium sp. S0630]|uniref:DUF4996 domain-containing protein n=1 Tax=unclassified Chryseobacterium TaxID=2593645 RepID=UPI0020A1E1DC|nr:DUF4996 domain-containing protein [Chryseobacterium sp. S0630]
MWVNSLWPHHNAGNNDDLVLDHPDLYWYINKGVNIIQTDRPKELIHYLKSKNLYF